MICLQSVVQKVPVFSFLVAHRTIVLIVSEICQPWKQVFRWSSPLAGTRSFQLLWHTWNLSWKQGLQVHHMIEYCPEIAPSPHFQPQVGCMLIGSELGSFSVLKLCRNATWSSIGPFFTALHILRLLLQYSTGPEISRYFQPTAIWKSWG